MNGTRFSVVNQPKERPQPINLLRDAAQVEQLVMNAIRAKAEDAVALPYLVRSFCSLVSIIQELRGIPKPGQLRPDLDPVQLAKALKRHKSRAVRQVLDVAGAAKAFEDDDQETTQEKLDTKEKTDKAREHSDRAKQRSESKEKESLKSDEGVPTEGRGEGEEGGAIVMSTPF